MKYQNLISAVENGEKLDDEHINAANQLLRSQFPDLQGLQSPLLGQRFCFPQFDVIMGYAGHGYIQVLHTGRDHWITIEILGEEEVRIYDSLFAKPTYCVMKQIASIVKSRSKQIHLLLEKVQCQKNAVDCGIYAIAYMTDLCYRVDPSSCCYKNSTLLRKHLIQCYTEGILTPFPSETSQKRRPSLYPLNIYCSCRLPFAVEHIKSQEVQPGEDTNMIQCEICLGWYHRTCVNLTYEEFKTLSRPQALWMCDFKGCAEAFDVFDSD